MKSFLAKRRKSVSGPSPAESKSIEPIPPVPAFARGSEKRGGLLDPKPLTVEMPDLRFSTLDLNIDLSKFKDGSDTRPGSVVQGEEKRKSKMSFLGFSNSKATQSTEEITVAKLGMLSNRAASTTSLADRKTRTPSPVPEMPILRNMHFPQTLPRTKMAEEDRRKVVASATEAMNLDVPVRAPLKHQTIRHVFSQPSLTPSAPEPKSKKDLKKEEKERAAREKELATLAKERAKREAKEAKDLAKREKELSRSKSKSDMDKAAAPLMSNREAEQQRHRGTAPPRPEPRRALDARTNVGAATTSNEKLRSRPSSGPSAAQRGRSTSSGSRPPSAPPSHKPPPTPISNAMLKQSHSSAPSPRPQSRGEKESKVERERHAGKKAFEFPKAPSSAAKPASSRSQSAIPAADGVARIVVNRGKTMTTATDKEVKNGTNTLGGPLTDSPPSQGPSIFPAPRKASKPASPSRGKQLTSSSEECGTSSSNGTSSLESNTSYRGDNSRESSMTGDDDENFVDANQHIVPGPRPKRDGEREEQRQSRLSLAGLDMEVARSAVDRVHQRTDSTDMFTALLMASQPGGGADRAKKSSENRQNAIAVAAETRAKKQMEAQRQFYLNNGKSYSGRAPPPPPQPVKRSREAAPPPKRRNTVRPELVVEGDGWKCLGVGDVDLPNVHDRMVTETILVLKAKSEVEETKKEEQDEQTEEDGEGRKDSQSSNGTPKVEEPEFEEQQVQVRYNDLFELLWTSTTPDVISRFVSYLDLSDLKMLRQVSHSIRFALNVNDNREMILNKYLTFVGYRTWVPTRTTTTRIVGRVGNAGSAVKDPCPLSIIDCEAFLISHDLLPEYAAVGKEFATHPEQMDPRMAQLAQASTRAYSRVLTRLRLQPVFKLPSQQATVAKATVACHISRAENSSAGLSAAASTLDVVQPSLPKHNSYYPTNIGSVTTGLGSSLHVDTNTSSPTADTNSPFSQSSTSPVMMDSPAATSIATMEVTPTSATPTDIVATPLPTQMASPWRPGRAAFYRVWVPASDPSGWLTDEELTRCESELYKAGIWSLMKKGDVIWNTATGDQMNEGKYIFDGHYLRDLSYAHDVAGHLPSWLNCVQFSPSYWHNIILASSARPVVYIDISPWKDQILSSLRLVQDHVESFSNQGSRYRVAKWVYRSAANVTAGQIISKMNGALEIADEGWNGRIIIETEGTAEHAKTLVSRCAGPNATPQAKAALLASVMGDATAARKMMNTSDTMGLTQPPPAAPSVWQQLHQPPPMQNEVQNSAWMIMRERSRPGQIWIKLASGGERS